MAGDPELGRIPPSGCGEMLLTPPTMLSVWNKFICAISFPVAIKGSRQNELSEVSSRLLAYYPTSHRPSCSSARKDSMRPRARHENDTSSNVNAFAFRRISLYLSATEPCNFFKCAGLPETDSTLCKCFPHRVCTETQCIPP